MSKEIKQDNGEILIYNADDGSTRIDVRFIDETVWLSQQQMAELFKTSRTNIVEHIGNIYDEGELNKESTCRDFRQVRKEGNRNVSRKITFYNLDMIISLGYRVKSKIATDFRKWATERLKEYIIKGFTMDDERLKNLGGGAYWKELLERIRDIRSSEKVFYRQVLDLFSTSIDYNSNSEEAKHFFATVQNKLHYAIHNHTTSEIIHSRVDSKKEFMGLTIFKGELPTLTEAKVAKNYLNEKELKSLNSLVSGYLDFAERQAEKKVMMTMKDWINHVDRILIATGEDLLKDNGKISRQQMIEKVEKEYKKYNEKTLTQVEKDYLLEINNIKNIASKGGDDNE
ncbi:virulence RhuM family protein [Gemella massiliensis]|uniref:virulence RhuM family protein n=1 Tax=Gemella massiliensis TaxID=1909670 RepID=UPI0009313CD5|nr:virulence RhuM family protein [Gemella massiliensis]